ncbi:MAG: hypothetical protein M5U19_15430 [Microthrixaceae bacterium]|nr:hypothetical protein [Microthrixaceae bacterium]
MLGDTDLSDAATETLELHRGLAVLGVRMRTVALGPGRRGGLDSVVPVLSPAARSLAATAQLRREQRWADVVVCWGLTASIVQRLSGSRRGMTTVVVLPTDETHRRTMASVAMRGALGALDGRDPHVWRGFLDAVHPDGARR